jgi:hypothetical protein
MILTLDPATVCGWAVGPPGAQPPLLQWGARDFGSGRTNGTIISMFRAWLNELCYQHRPSFCVFETPYIPRPPSPFAKKGAGGPPMNPLVLRRLLGMTGQIEAICEEFRILCREATSGEFTKYMTGKGRFPGGRKEKKRAVIDACRRYGCDVSDDNAADALALWFYAESFVDDRAAAHRSRLAADRIRSAAGEGPLFAVGAA